MGMVMCRNIIQFDLCSELSFIHLLKHWVPMRTLTIRHMGLSLHTEWLVRFDKQIIYFLKASIQLFILGFNVENLNFLVQSLWEWEGDIQLLHAVFISAIVFFNFTAFVRSFIQVTLLAGQGYSPLHPPSKLKELSEKRGWTVYRKKRISTRRPSQVDGTTYCITLDITELTKLTIIMMCTSKGKQTK